MNEEQRQAADDLRSSKPIWAASSPVGAIVYTRHRYLLLLCPKGDDTHFTVPQCRISVIEANPRFVTLARTTRY